MKESARPPGQRRKILVPILIALAILFVLVTWAMLGPPQPHAEPGPVIQALSESAGLLSFQDKGQAMLYLAKSYDIAVECGFGCHVTATPLDEQGLPGNESYSGPIPVAIKPVSLEGVNKITLEKRPGEEVVLSGGQAPDILGPGTEVGVLNVMNSPPMCIEPRFSRIIGEASKRYDIPEELIAAIIVAESSWNPYGHRYEPGFQLEHLEGEPEWIEDPAWCFSGPSIRDWFLSNPERSEEMSGLTEEELDTHAQTRVSASYGLMQVLYTSAIPYCGYQGEPEGLYDVRTNVFCGTKSLRDKLDEYDGDLAHAISAYNAGEALWPYDEQNSFYTERVLGYYRAFMSCQE